MPRKKAAEATIEELRWLSKAQAMAWVGVKTEENFNTDWRPYLNLYDNGSKGGRYDKKQLDAFMESRLCIKGQPFEEWRPRTIG